MTWAQGKPTEDLHQENVPCDEGIQAKLWPTARPKLLSKPVRCNQASNSTLKNSALFKNPALRYTKPVQTDRTEPKVDEDFEASSKEEIDSFLPDKRIALNWELADHSFSVSPREQPDALIPQINNWRVREPRSDSQQTSIDRLRLLSQDKPSSITMKVYSGHTESSTTNRQNDLQEFTEPTNHSPNPATFNTYLQQSSNLRRQTSSPKKPPTSILSRSKITASSHRVIRQRAIKENTPSKRVTFSSNNIVVVLME